MIVAPYQEEHNFVKNHEVMIHDSAGPSSISSHWEYGLVNSKQSAMLSPNFCLSPHPTMYPFVAQSSYTAGFPYLVNSFLSSGPGAEITPVSAPISPSYQRISAAYRKPPSPALTAHNGYSPSRSASTYSGLDRRQHASRVNRNHFQSPGSHHNYVDIYRIREGIDVRTTV